MKKLNTLSLATIALAALTPLSHAALVHAYEFNTLADTEGFSTDTLNVSGLTADGDSLNGTATNNDPQLKINGASLSPTVGETWTMLEFRVREVRLAAHGAGEPTTADELPFNGTGVILGTVAAPAPTNFTAGFSGSALDGSGFSTVTLDISAFGSKTITNLRLDPIGGAWSNSNSETNGNSFEVDYIRFYDTSVVPEPSSAALLGLGGLALILRRRK
ncbi:MAG: PEP-CTERM sorting domain-containing protein [Akkermansiaceae bacterium]